ncbi:MAG: hypothetical protein HYV27_23975 [Candidatus Hydrogenedentes bacterium]|nr:hypothetical protein [Candidatus Hydrogenedentota bacterium]
MRKRPVPKAVLILLLLGVQAVGAAQESLDTLLLRGYVAHWLVCGPFASDLPNGILAAATGGTAALGATDYQTPAGGVARVRPQHLLAIPTPGGEAIWQEAGTQSRFLDLAPFFESSSEGVSYAAFYIRCDRNRTVLMELKTLLGARVWLNGFPVSDISGQPIQSMGVTQKLITFRQGQNLLLIELPGLRFETLSQAYELPPRAFGAQYLANRPELQNSSGFSFHFRLRPAAPVGSVAYITELDETGTFSGSKFDIRQDALLTLFNYGKEKSGPVKVNYSVPGALEPVEITVPPFDVETVQTVPLALPIMARAPGETIPVEATLVHGEATATLKAPVTVRPVAPDGRVYVVTGARFYPEFALSQRDAQIRFQEGLERQSLLLKQEPNYGMDLGYVSDWLPRLSHDPEMLKAMKISVAAGQSGTRLGLAQPDARIVGGETLFRNLVLGALAAQRFLEDPSPSYVSWSDGGIAPQMPQMLNQFSQSGVLSNADVTGLPALSQQTAPSGATVLHRRKRPSPGPATADELRRAIALQRQEIIGLGIAADVLVVENLLKPPEPFYFGASQALARNFPSIRIQGNGINAFTGEVLQGHASALPLLLHSSRPLNIEGLGAASVHPELKQAFAFAESQLLLAEPLATWAALEGAVYPHETLDHAWRALIAHSTPAFLGAPVQAENYVEAHRAYAQLLTGVREVQLNSLRYIANEADTLQGAPAGTTPAAAIVVYNPVATTRNAPCSVDVTLEGVPGIGLVDAQGVAVPFLAEQTVYGTAGALQSARLTFVARDLPAMGYQTYYMLPEGSLSEASVLDERQIESSRFLLNTSMQDGSILRFLDKSTGLEIAGDGLDRVTLLAMGESGATPDEVVLRPESTRESPGPPQAELRKTSWMQTLRLVSPFAGGKLTRRYTVYEDVPYVECQLEIEGASLGGHVLAVTHAPLYEGQSLRYGERDAALLGAPNLKQDSLITRGHDRPTGSALYPAYQWVASTPDVSVEVGRAGAVPLLPATIHFGSKDVLRDAARILQQALARKGVTAALQADAIQPPNPLWTDSTELLDFNDWQYHGAPMRFLVGGPDSNLLSKALLEAAPPDIQAEFERRQTQDVLLFLMDNAVPEGAPARPVFLFAGPSSVHIHELVTRIARELDTRDTFSLPVSAYLAGTPPEPLTQGLAVLFPGARTAAMDPDGTLWQILGQWAGEEMETGLIAPPGAPVRFQHALAPLNGTWRDAHVPQLAQGYSQPVLAVQTGLHGGRQPIRQSFLTSPQPNLLIQSVKPVGYPLSQLSAERPTPRDGVIVRAVESEGRNSAGDLSWYAPLSGAAGASPLDEIRERIETVENRLPVTLAPWQIASWWCIPVSRAKMGDPVSLEATNPSLLEHSKFWEYNLGSAPPGNAPLDLSLDGYLEGNSPQIRVGLVNHTNRIAQGAIFLQGSADLSVGPGQLYYQLAPGESMLENLEVVPLQEQEHSGIVAYTEWNGKILREVMHRQEGPFEVNAARSEAQITVEIANRSGIPVVGTAELIMETPEAVEYGRGGPIPPMARQTVEVAPFNSVKYFFAADSVQDRRWRVVKVAANGEVAYNTVP